MSLYGGVAEPPRSGRRRHRCGPDDLGEHDRSGHPTPVVHKVIQDYRRQRNAGLDPVFDPVALGIKNATYWEEIRKSEAAVK